MSQTKTPTHLPFAIFFTQKIIQKNPALEPYREDLISAAIVGLIEAEKKFDPSKGTKFTTFAVYHIKNRVYEEITNITTKGLKKSQPLVVKESKIRKELKKNKNASYAEISQKTDIKEKKVKQIIEEKKTTVSIEDYIGEDLQIKDTLGTDPTTNMEKELDLQKLQKLIKKAVSKLNEKERKIIKERYLKENKTLREIGEEMGISKERVRQIEKNALEKMKRFMVKNKVDVNDFIYF
ncbi:sigma-70 family RNA polymerase sigma factor [Persephonella sp. KM09-Lau-8]|uniref:sigma-70 family RNA polymerase sigma factor n=1 Tax=Persephonella sp. KM09-Lau-8 TaxID=1158345 RepID=UPI0012DE04BA|nr:sigma-70 family RNA polymerase sigma factor [Persephonella sp. KM09-Lau-8]